MRKLFPNEIKAKLLDDYLSGRNNDLILFLAKKNLPAYQRGIYKSEAEKFAAVRRILKINIS